MTKPNYNNNITTNDLLFTYQGFGPVTSSLWNIYANIIGYWLSRNNWKLFKSLVLTCNNHLYNKYCHLWQSTSAPNLGRAGNQHTWGSWRATVSPRREGSSGRRSSPRSRGRWIPRPPRYRWSRAFSGKENKSTFFYFLLWNILIQPQIWYVQWWNIE